MDYLKNNTNYQPLSSKDHDPLSLTEDVAIADISKAGPQLLAKLVDLNNLYSAMSIVSALQVECIYRLRHTWDGLNNKDRATYRRLEELFSQDDNCRRQREHLKSTSLPGIPYLGLYLSDLTYTNVAHPRAGGQPTAVWTAKINAIIDIIAHFQQSEYPFTVDPPINTYLCAQQYIEELQKFLEEDNYRTSLRLEPPPPMSAEHNSTAASFAVSPTVTTTTTSNRRPSLLPKFPTELSAGRSFRSPSKTHNPSKSISASINSSFEFDAFKHHHHHQPVMHPTSPINDLLLAGDEASAGACCSTPIAQMTKKTLDSSMGQFSKSKFLFSDMQNESDSETVKLVKLSPTPEASPSCCNADGMNGNYESHSNPTLVPMDHTSSPAKLPPIPPRPPCERGHLQQQNQQHTRLQHSVSETKPCFTTPSLCQEPVGDFGGGGGGGNAASLVDSKSNLSSPVREPVHQSKETQSEPIVDETDNCCLRNQFSNINGDAMDVAAIAVCAAAVAKNQCMASTTDVSSAHLAPTITAANSSSPCRHGSEHNLLDQHVSCDGAQFGVRIIYQGAVQRRTMVEPRNEPATGLAALLSPKLRKTPGPMYDSTSSIAGSTADGGGSSGSLLMHARPAGFSSWRRFWATLVLVEPGSAAFMIYFEPRSKNAASRNEFKAHQCQVQNLLNTQATATSNASHFKSGEVLRNEIFYSNHDSEVGEISELLDVNSVSEPATPRQPHTMPRNKFASVGTTPVVPLHLFDLTAARVEIGRHRDGTVDPSSFLLSDPNRNKAYRFRPIRSNSDQQPALTRTTGAFDWLRRSGIHSPRINPRVPEPTPSLQTPYSYSSLGRPRGSSVPGIASPSAILPCGSGSGTLRSVRGLDPPSGHDLISPVDARVNDWVQSIRKVLGQVQDFRRRQLVAYYAFQAYQRTERYRP